MNTTHKIKLILVLWAVACLAGPVAWAQDGDNSSKDRPPEIMTSDLSLKTILESDRLDVTFVIIDADKVAEVTIDGEVQKFEPGDTVMITKQMAFTQEVTRVTVVAKDEKGNTNQVTYTVYLPGVDPEKVVAKKAALTWFVSYDARFEVDTNPSNDLSSPIAINGIDLVGVVPDDRQTDNRTNVTVFGGVTKGPWNVFMGLVRIGYSDADFAKRYDVQMNLLGGAYRKSTGGLEVEYTFADINLGNYDYALTHTVSPGWRKFSKDKGGNGTTLYGADLTKKDFANSDQEDATNITLKWDYRFKDDAGQDTYRRTTVLGSASDGLKATDYTFLGIAMDWGWKWDSGVLWDFGWGTQYRSYKNDVPLSTDTPLGDTRVDLPFRVSTALGWQFSKRITVVGNYKYVFNLSNKSPYVRQVYGVSVNGRF